MKTKRCYIIIIFAILITLNIKNVQSKIYQDTIDDFETNYDNPNKNHHKSKQNTYYNYDHQNKKPRTSFDLLLSTIKNRFYSFFDRYRDYIDGFKFVLNFYSKLFNRVIRGNKIINKTISSTNFNYSKYFDNDNTQIRNLENIKIIIKKKKNAPNYPYNNTDLYNNTQCPTYPNLKVFYYLYYCDNEQVSKEIYDLKKNESNCEFYNNTNKICICPMHYENCKQTKLSKLFCMTKELIVNDKINITEYTDTFFEEYFKTPYINTDYKKNIKFEMKIKCGMPISDDITGSNINFYLSNVNDNKSEFDIIETVYNKGEEGKQYSKEELKNNTMEILEYFVKKKNLVLYKKPKLNVTFSIIDQQWVIPYRIKNIEINEGDIEQWLSGEKSFVFYLDLEDLIKNGKGIGPFEESNTKYPYFNKGDLYFYEITIDDLSNQVSFFPFRGEIKK